MSDFLDFLFHRLFFYVLYVLTYGFMIVTLYTYGQEAPDHVWFLLLWLTFWTIGFSYILYGFYEIRPPFNVEELKYIFVSQKRSFMTPFFVLGTLSAINYILVAVANPHVESIYQVLASILQLPIVIFF